MTTSTTSCTLFIFVFLSVIALTQSISIVSPPQFFFRDIEALKAQFSAAIPRPPGLTARIVASDPLTACDPFINAHDMVGNIAIVMRGACLYVTKAQNAVSAGAAAIIVVNTADAVTEMSYDGVTILPIVSMMINSSYGVDLINNTRLHEINATIVQSPASSADTLALLDLKTSLGGDNWGHTSVGAVRGWNISSDPCTHWQGVNCYDDGSIKVLYLDSIGAVGSLSPSLVSLKSLSKLDLHVCDIDMLPAWLGSLTNLTSMTITACNMKGSIPDTFFQLKKLKSLILSNNELSGTIPDWLGSLPQLQTILLNNNNISGTLPLTLNNLVDLRALDVRANSLTGSVSIHAFYMKSLTTLGLGDNFFFGTIHSSICNSTSITTIDLSSNMFDGALPPMKTMTGLLTIDVSQNRFSGLFPDISTLTSLSKLDISHNLFTGTVPVAELPSNIKYYYASHNNYSSIPASLQTKTSLFVVDLSHNSIRGPFWETVSRIPQASPAQVAQGQGLLRMDFSYNQIGTDIQYELFLDNYPTLMSYIMSHNNLTKQLRVITAGHKFIETIDFSFNQMVGTLPAEIALLPSLRRVDFSSNKFVHWSSLAGDQNTDLPPGYTPDYSVYNVNSTGNFSCPDVSLSDIPLATVIIDPSYYDYQLCHCNYGTRKDPDFNSGDLNNATARQLRCIACPEHVTCVGGNSGRFILEAYYWPTPSPTNPRIMIPCEVCNPTGVASSSFECVAGHEGRMCSQCSVGYFRQGRECSACAPYGFLLTGAILIFVVFVFIFFALTFTWCSGAFLTVLPEEAEPNADALAMKKNQVVELSERSKNGDEDGEDGSSPSLSIIVSTEPALASSEVARPSSFSSIDNTNDDDDGVDDDNDKNNMEEANNNHHHHRTQQQQQHRRHSSSFGHSLHPSTSGQDLVAESAAFRAAGGAAAKSSLRLPDIRRSSSSLIPPPNAILTPHGSNRSSTISSSNNNSNMINGLNNNNADLPSPATAVFPSLPKRSQSTLTLSRTVSFQEAPTSMNRYPINENNIDGKNDDEDDDDEDEDDDNNGHYDIEKEAARRQRQQHKLQISKQQQRGDNNEDDDDDRLPRLSSVTTIPLPPSPLSLSSSSSTVVARTESGVEGDEVARSSYLSPAPLSSSSSSSSSSLATRMRSRSMSKYPTHPRRRFSKIALNARKGGVIFRILYYVLQVRSHAALSIAINYYQTLSILTKNLPQPLSIYQLLHVFNFSNFSASGFGIECLDQRFLDALYGYLFTMMQPLAVLFVGLVVFLTGMVYFCITRRDSTWFKYMCGRTTLFLLNFLYFPVITAALSVMTCTPDPYTGDNYLSSLPHVPCYHIPLGLKFATIIVYAIGIFLLFGALIYMYQFGSKTRKLTIRRYFGFFFEHFEFRWTTLSLVLLGRRVLFSLLNSLSSSISASILMANLFILLISAAFFLRAWPYRASIDNYLEVVCLVSLIVSYSANYSFSYTVQGFIKTSTDQSILGGEVIYWLLQLCIVSWLMFVFCASKLPNRFLAAVKKR